jgi:hypothetical protein
VQLRALFAKLGRIGCEKFGDTPTVKGLAIGGFFFLRCQQHSTAQHSMAVGVPHRTCAVARLALAFLRSLRDSRARWLLRARLLDWA